MINKIFIDTGGFYSSYDKDDSNNKKAKEIWKEISESYKLITTNYVIEEVATLLRYRLGVYHSIEFIKHFKETRKIIVQEVTNDTRKKAWDIFMNYNDKDFSFTDCTSFVVMKDENISLAFSWDHHFVQMGFALISSKDA